MATSQIYKPFGDILRLCPIVENMAGSSVKLRPMLIVHTAPRAHQSNCAQGSSVKLRPGLIRRSAPRRIRRTAPGRKWAHPVPKYTSPPPWSWIIHVYRLSMWVEMAWFWWCRLNYLCKSIYVYLYIKISSSNTLTNTFNILFSH